MCLSRENNLGDRGAWPLTFFFSFARSFAVASNESWAETLFTNRGGRGGRYAGNSNGKKRKEERLRFGNSNSQNRLSPTKKMSTHSRVPRLKNIDWNIWFKYISPWTTWRFKTTVLPSFSLSLSLSPLLSLFLFLPFCLSLFFLFPLSFHLVGRFRT